MGHLMAYEPLNLPTSKFYKLANFGGKVVVSGGG